MFDWEELSQTVDKSKKGRPDRVGQPLEAAAEGTGQPAAALLHKGRGYPAFRVKMRVRVAAGARGNYALLHDHFSKVLILHFAFSHFEKPQRAQQVKNL